MKRGIKIGAAMAAGLLALTGCSSSGGSTDGGSTAGSDVKVGMAYDLGGRTDQSFGTAAAAGLDKAVADYGVTFTELEQGSSDTDVQREERLRLLATQGHNPVVAVGYSYAKAVEKVAKEFPDTEFAIVDDSNVQADNITNLVFAEEQGSFLTGAIAAQASKTGKVGFIGGMEIPLIQKFEAGFAAGAKQVNPDIKVQVKYLSQPGGSSNGFDDVAGARAAADGMYDAGVDVIFHAAGGSGAGLFEAAKAADKLAVGVDSDQYLAVDETLKPVVLTSMVKRVDVAVYDMIKSVVDGSPLSGVQTFDLNADGVGYATSNPAVEPFQAKADALKQDIIDGKITVPTS